MCKGVLVLSHQMKSMVEPLCSHITAMGLKCFVLSSRPAQEPESGWVDLVDEYAVTSDHYLDYKSLATFMTTLPSDTDLAACITVWDGYRDLMAYANNLIGAPDISPDKVELLRDKLNFRLLLRELNLSNVEALKLTGDVAESLEDRDNWFVKPTTGLASMGTFRASKLNGWKHLETLWKSASNDKSYAGIFTGKPSFMIEQYISGTECSFEVLVEKNSIHILAIHEKICITDTGKHIQEGACIAPPISLNLKYIENGEDFVASVIKTLDLNAGAYHIEAKCDKEGLWELIEINPRIGGAYIVRSTECLSGVNLLEAWLLQLLGKPFIENVKNTKRTFFRVYFGEPGKTLSELNFLDCKPLASEKKLFCKVGSRLPDTEREIFVGQALWSDVDSLTENELSILVRESKDILNMEYESGNSNFTSN